MSTPSAQNPDPAPLHADRVSSAGPILHFGIAGGRPASASAGSSTHFAFRESRARIRLVRWHRPLPRKPLSPGRQPSQPQRTSAPESGPHLRTSILPSATRSRPSFPQALHTCGWSLRRKPFRKPCPYPLRPPPLLLL